MKRILLGFFSVNLFVIGPLFALMCVKAIRVVEVRAVSPDPVSVQIGEYALDDTGTRVPRFEKLVHFPGKAGAEQTRCCYIPNEIKLRDLAMQLSGAQTNRFSLCAVTVGYAGIFKRTLDMNSANGRSQWIAQGLCLPRKVWFGLLVAELMLLIFSWVCSLCMNCDSAKGAFVPAFAVAGLVSVFLFVIVPYQSFSANRMLYDYPIGVFLLQTLIPAIGFWLFTSLGLILLQKNFGFLWHWLFVGFVIYEYLNTGILAAHEPPVNGETIYYTNHFLIRRDLIILASVAFAPLFAYRWIKPYLNWTVLGLCLMVAASLFDVRVETEAGADHTGLETGVCSKMDAAQNTRYSQNRNVMMFVLDSISTEVARDLCSRFPEIRSGLDGFTLFANHVGQYPCTHYAVAGFMTTNAYCGAEQTLDGQKFAAGWMGKNSILQPYFASNMPVYCITGHAMNAFAWPRATAQTDVPARIQTPSVFFHRPDGPLSLTLFETVRFRLTPFFGKRMMLVYTFAGTKNHGRIEDEPSLYAILRNGKIGDAPNTLSVFHTHGGHGPYCVDREGNAITPRYSYDGFADQSYYAMRQLIDLFAEFRRKNIYDNSTIIVIADHGSPITKTERRENELSGSAFPMCFIKPANSHHALSIDAETPTSHSRLASLVMRLQNAELDIAQIRSHLKCEDRVFIQTGHDPYEVWSVDTHGKGRKIN